SDVADTIHRLMIKTKAERPSMQEAEVALGELMARYPATIPPPGMPVIPSSESLDRSGPNTRLAPPPVMTEESAEISTIDISAEPVRVPATSTPALPKYPANLSNSPANFPAN